MEWVCDISSSELGSRQPTETTHREDSINKCCSI